MKITASVIKADIGSIGGHICPSPRLLEGVRVAVRDRGAGLLRDAYVSHTGDDIAILSCAAFSVHGGKLTGPVDAFDHPFWDRVRTHVSDKAAEMRRQGFFGAAMLPWTELEYTGIAQMLEALDARFSVRKEKG